METLTIGIALTVALSSALLEWARHIAAVPATSYVLLFPILLAIAARTTPVGPRAKSEGLLLMAVATAISLLASVSASERFGRIAIPFGIIGFLRFTGKATHATAGLTMFVVPVPHKLVEIAPLEAVWMAFAEATVGATHGTLRVDEWDSGIRLVALFAGLGWYAAAREGCGWRKAFQRAAAMAMLGLPVQMAATMVAVALARAGAPELGRTLLTHGVWLGVALATILYVELRPARPVEGEVPGV